MQKDLDTVGEGFKGGIEKWATAKVFRFYPKSCSLRVKRDYFKGNKKLEAVKETLYVVIKVACAVALSVATADGKLYPIFIPFHN